jgi:hypothetical protein
MNTRDLKNLEKVTNVLNEVLESYIAEENTFDLEISDVFVTLKFNDYYSSDSLEKRFGVLTSFDCRKERDGSFVLTFLICDENMNILC